MPKDICDYEYGHGGKGLAVAMNYRPHPDNIENYKNKLENYKAKLAAHKEDWFPFSRIYYQNKTYKYTDKLTPCRKTFRYKRCCP